MAVNNPEITQQASHRPLRCVSGPIHSIVRREGEITCKTGWLETIEK
jgi:hypothetical protein